MTFVLTDSGWLNLDTVKLLRVRDPESRETLEAEVDGMRVRLHKNRLNEAIINIIPCVGWEHLTTCDEGNGRLSVSQEPIIAWGLNALGIMLPILPSSPYELSDFASSSFRKKNESQVFMAGQYFDDADAWLAPMQKAGSK